MVGSMREPKLHLSASPATISEEEYREFPNLEVFLHDKCIPCDAKIRRISFMEGNLPTFDTKSSKLSSSASKTNEKVACRNAEVLIIESIDACTIQEILQNKVSGENRLSFLAFLDAYLHDQPSFDYGDARHRLAPMPSVVTKQQHVTFTYVTAREFEVPFHLGYRELQRAGKAAGAWRIDRTWGPMNPVQWLDSNGGQSSFCPLAITRTQAGAWFDRDANNEWHLGVILVDEPPKFTGLRAVLKQSRHNIVGRWHPDSGSSSDLLLQCMKQNTNLQTTAIPSPLMVLQDMYRVISFEWTLLTSYYTRDLNSIEWALQHGRGDCEIHPKMLRDAMRNLLLSRRRIPWYRSLIRDQLVSCQPKGRCFWGLASGDTTEAQPSETTASIAQDLVDDFQQLQLLMTQIYERMNMSMAYITGEASVLEAQRSHNLNQITFQQNRITFAQSKVLLALALVGTFFLPINAIAAIFSMGGKWAPGESLFPVFWAICIPTSMGLVSALLVFMYCGANRRMMGGGVGIGRDVAGDGYVV